MAPTVRAYFPPSDRHRTVARKSQGDPNYWCHRPVASWLGEPPLDNEQGQPRQGDRQMIVLVQPVGDARIPSQKLLPEHGHGRPLCLSAPAPDYAPFTLPPRAPMQPTGLN